MQEYPPQIEVIQAPSYGSGLPDSKHWYQSRRLITFTLVFTLSLAAGLVYTFIREPVYQSSASLLTRAPGDIDQPAMEADIQHVAIQRELLLGQPLLAEVVNALILPSGTSPLSVDMLQSMLSVIPVPETNLVELRARGPDAAILPGLVNSWIDAYERMRVRQMAAATDATTTALKEQFEEYGYKVEEKRTELDHFRKDNDIITMEREDNRTIARLKGLNKSLNTANEEAVSARANLNAVKAAIARGEAVVPDSDKSSLVNLEARAQELREILKENDKRFTENFIALDPSLNVLPEQLEKLENEIAQKRAYGQQIVLTDAQQSYEAAQQSVVELQQQIDDLNQEVTEFTTQFSRHEALVEELAQLEELYRELGERLIRIDVKNQDRYPPLRVLERAYPPSKRIFPSYTRDAGIALAASLLLGLLVVWIVDYLTSRRTSGDPLSVTGIRIHADAGHSAIPDRSQPGVLSHAPGLALESMLPRELSVPEVKALLDTSGSQDTQLITLLLCGLTLDEILALQPEDVDLEQGQLHVTGSSSRVLAIPESLGNSFLQSGGVPAWLQDRDVEVNAQELEARITCSAIDSGLASPDTVHAATVRHTYLAYLVRQGVRLSELERIAGPVSPTILAQYGRLSPAGPGKSMELVNVVYPYL